MKTLFALIITAAALSPAVDACPEGPKGAVFEEYRYLDEWLEYGGELSLAVPPDDGHIWLPLFRPRAATPTLERGLTVE